MTKKKKKLKSPNSITDQGKTIKNLKTIMEHFNKFFTEICTIIQNKISHTKKYYTELTNLLN